MTTGKIDSNSINLQINLHLHIKLPSRSLKMTWTKIKTTYLFNKFVKSLMKYRFNKITKLPMLQQKILDVLRSSLLLARMTRVLKLTKKWWLYVLMNPLFWTISKKVKSKMSKQVLNMRPNSDNENQKELLKEVIEKSLSVKDPVSLEIRWTLKTWVYLIHN